ncbi:MAG: ribokinase [Paenibacillus sp.]|uniref:ribokinase n=1 Tax=Paenibacillus sp. TaxID=58172 RepID=UPI0029079367|nr:ribokinase [Paenibacillus sp.]MDU4698206.1 ribokinase [Paenibacillus sp.]
MAIPKVAVIGSLNMDIVVETRQIPQTGETVLGDRVRFIPGGKGANQAVAAARLGADTSMIGAVGADAFGDQLLAALRQDGVDIGGVKQLPDAATGVASIYVADGDNRIVVVSGANDQVTPADIDLHADKLEQADIVLLQLEIPVETVLYAARIAKSLGKTVILNPAPARELPDELYGYMDYMTPNLTELGRYAGMEPAATRDFLRLAMSRLKDLGATQIVTTLGANGSAYLDEAGEVRTVPGHPVSVVDTTGAGDCFNAALATALAQGQSLEEAMRFASLASALAVTKFGAQAGMPTGEEVRRFAAAGSFRATTLEEQIRVKRIYEPASPEDGYRILVDRLWPRGMTKADAAIDEWMKGIAPSPELRKEFAHRMERYADFSANYLRELDTSPECAVLADRIRELAGERPVTLLYAAKDPVYNHANVLRRWLVD